MIRTVADLLDAFAGAEAQLLAASDIKHAPTIGAMYEGLTRDLLRRSLPDGVELWVVHGFVTDGSGGQSGQIDCMLVRGTGEPIPHVPGAFQWHVKDVLAVLEVKKTLSGDELGAAHGHLQPVLDLQGAWIRGPHTSPVSVNLRPALRVFAQLTGKSVYEREEWEALPLEEQLILYSLFRDYLSPLRLIFGYQGIKTEIGLRNSFVRYLENNLSRSGFGPGSLPNLVVSGSVSLVKLDGQPYRGNVTREGYWEVMASSRANPCLLLLELIWTRLSYDFAMGDAFGDDLTMEAVASLLLAKLGPDPTRPGAWGWLYQFVPATAKDLAALPRESAWEPVELDRIQFIVINQLCNDDVPVDSPEFRAFLAEHNRAVGEFVDSLIATGLVAVAGDRLTLTTIACHCAILPDGRYIAADDNTGRLSRWVAKHMAERIDGFAS